MIDSLIRVHRQHESDAASMALVMESLRRIANWGTTVLVLHHHKKGKGKKGEKLRGSTDILGGIDVEFSLTARRNHLIFESGKTRTKPVPPITLRKIFKKKRIELIYKGKELTDDKKILSEIKRILEKGETGVKEIKEALKGKGIKIADQRLRNILKEAVKKGSITAEKAGPRKIVYGLKPIS